MLAPGLSFSIFCSGLNMLMAWFWQGWFSFVWNHPDSKVHGANMGPIWGRQDPGGPHVGPMNFAIWARMGFVSDAAKHHNVSMSSGFVFTNELWAQNSNYNLLLLANGRFNLATILHMSRQLCCRDICAKLWLRWIFDNWINGKFYLMRIWWWVHKLSLKKRALGFDRNSSFFMHLGNDCPLCFCNMRPSLT